MEWEAAARGENNARKYPWGNKWNKEKANCIEGRVMKPSPVGAYTAAGAVGSFGTEDQAGNVYDWTSSLYLPYPSNAEKSEPEELAAERAVLGGSWGGDRGDVRCAFRGKLVPADFSSNIGFRFVFPGSDISAS